MGYFSALAVMLLINILQCLANNNAVASDLLDVKDSNIPTVAPTIYPTDGKPYEFIPTAPPTILPTLSPSSDLSIPTGYPTGPPTMMPSQPTMPPTTAVPTLTPTNFPTPNGRMNKDWWYLVTSDASLYAESFNDLENDDIVEAVNYAFSFVLTDPIEDDVERSKVEVEATAVNHNNERKNALEDSDSMREFNIKAWCPDITIANKVMNTMEQISVETILIIEPLHEHELREVMNVTISDIAMATTTNKPPSGGSVDDDVYEDDEFEGANDPVRITYIILGTIALFAIGTCCITQCWSKEFRCSRSCIEDSANGCFVGTLQCFSWSRRATGTLYYNVRQYYNSGFNMQVPTDEEDFYGESRHKLPSDNLNIHYSRGSNASLRENNDMNDFAGTIAAPPSVARGTSSYLEDEEARISMTYNNSGSTGVEMTDYGGANSNSVCNPMSTFE